MISMDLSCMRKEGKSVVCVFPQMLIFKMRNCVFCILCFSILELLNHLGNLKAHSFRGASTSAAFLKGCKLRDTFKAADWSSDKNFRNVDLRYTMKNKSFVNSVFSK